MKMQLRPYQKQAVSSVLEEWDRGVDRTLVVLPTGAGKTIVFAGVVEEVVRRGGRVLVLAHRGELLDQAADKILRATGLGCACEKAEQTAEDTWYNVTVGSVQSFNPKRLSRISPETYTHIVVDEAHHALAESYMRILNHFSDSKVLGVTATADRGDKRELGAVFKTLAYVMTIVKAVRDGWLCPIKSQMIPIRLNLTHNGDGDYTDMDCANALEPYLEQIADEIYRCAKDRKTIVFLPLISISERFCALLQSRGMDAREVNGASADRCETLEWFSRSGKGSVLCNAMLLTEGFDEPSTDCVVVLRPTKVRALYVQMVGRGFRLSPGKENLLLLDFLWMTSRHNLVRPVNLVCSNPDLQDRVTELLAEESQDGPVDLLEAEEEASGKAAEERSAALARELEAQRRKKARLVDPLQYCYSVGETLDECDSDLEALQPMTAEQARAIENFGINPEGVPSKGQATQLIGTLVSRSQGGYATAKQIRCLERSGFVNVGRWSFAEANRMIARISANGWRVPRGVDPSEYIPGGDQ